MFPAPGKYDVTCLGRQIARPDAGHRKRRSPPQAEVSESFHRAVFGRAPVSTKDCMYKGEDFECLDRGDTLKDEHTTGREWLKVGLTASQQDISGKARDSLP